MYAFYDFETSGAETAFDQPLQFAAVLTDEKFNELESINLRCRLAPHILPAPWAMQVTGISLEQLTNPSPVKDKVENPISVATNTPS